MSNVSLPGMRNWKHDELAEDLARFQREKTDRIVWTDMQLGPAGSPRPDVYTVPLSFSRFQPLAYECKVSISDFRADITKGKWSDYLRFSCAVIFAVPEGLITKADLPPGCGLMVRGEKGWRTVKGPTMRALENLPRDAWIKLLIDGVKREGERTRLVPLDIYTANRKLRKTLGERVADVLHERNMVELRFEHATAELRKAGDKATAEYRRIVDAAKERASADVAALNSIQVELAHALGLPPDASIHLIKRTAEKAASALNQDEVVQDLKDHIAKIERAVELAKLKIPPLAQTNDMAGHELGTSHQQEITSVL